MWLVATNAGKLQRNCASREYAYLGQNHSRDLLGGEGLGLAEVLNLDLGVTSIVNDLEGPALHVLLDGGVIESATDETPSWRVTC